jgi:copper chaperone NosL
MRFGVFLLFALALLAAGCAQGTAEIAPPEIRYGEDVCAECKMIISDPRFAAGYAYEIAPGRFETVAFDDIGDMLSFASKHPEHDVAAWYVHDYETKEWIDATTASYLVSDQVETPMASGIASFANRDRAEVMAASLGVQVMDWSALLETFQAGEIGASMSDMIMPAAGND